MLELQHNGFCPLGQYQCYFTYFVILQPQYRDEVEKILAHTTDPIHALSVINCN